MKRSFCVAMALMVLFGCQSKKDVKQPETKTPETKKTPVAKTPAKDNKEKASDEIKDGEIKLPPKDCIKDYKAHAKKRLKALTDEEPANVIHGEFEDVDGDGQKEKTAAVAYAYNAHTVLYLSNKGCTKEAGNFMGTAFTAQKTTTGGKKDIQLWTKAGGCAGLAGSITPFKWDEGTKQYKSGKAVDCPCPMNSRVKKFPAGCPGAKRQPAKVTFN